MKQSIITAILSIFMLTFDATSQSRYPYEYQGPKGDPDYVWLLLRADSVTESGQQIARRRAAEQKEQEFWMKAKEFVASWTALGREYNEQGTFNVKIAKQVSKAFHELEKSEGWPK